MCILVNYLKSFFWNTQEHNKSISTSCVCKYGTLFFPEQFSHPLAPWVFTQLCKGSQADPITPISQTRKRRYLQAWSGLQKRKDPPLHLYRRLPEPFWRRRQEHETNSPLGVFLLVDVDWQGRRQGWGHQVERMQIGVTTGFRDSSESISVLTSLSAISLF